MSELCDLITRHCRRDLTTTAFPRLVLSRVNAPTTLTAAMYYPLLCVVARGRKRIILVREEFYYDPNSYLIASLDLPVSGQVIEAPCLGVTLALDLPTLAALVLQMPPSSGERAASKALAVHPLEADLLDPLLRLLRAAWTGRRICPCSHRSLNGKFSTTCCAARAVKKLRQMALPNSQLSQISRAIHLIRQRYQEKIPVEEMARTRTDERDILPPSFPRGDGHEPAAISEALPARRKHAGCCLSCQRMRPGAASTWATKAHRNSAASTAAFSANRPAGIRGANLRPPEGGTTGS